MEGKNIPGITELRSFTRVARQYKKRTAAPIKKVYKKSMYIVMYIVMYKL